MLADVLESRSTLLGEPLPGLAWSQLTLHGQYQLREVLTAVGFLPAEARPFFNTGVHRIPSRQVEILFVTLDKSSGYHEGISYHDYAISRSRFHWQSQNSAGSSTAAGRRYLESASNGWTFQLFVRPDRDNPYVACGPVRLVEAHGDKPMNIVWKLERSLTARLFQQFSVLRGQ